MNRPLPDGGRRVLSAEMSPSRWRKLNAHRDHRWAGGHISAYVDPGLPKRKQRRLAAHEELCPDCNRVVRTLRRMLNILPSMRPAAPGHDHAERTSREVMRAIETAGGPGDRQDPTL